MEDVRSWPGEPPDGVWGQDLGVRGRGGGGEVVTTELVTTDMQRGPVMGQTGGGGQPDTRGLAGARQVDRESRHKRGRDEGRGVDTEDGVRMRRARGEQGQRLGGQLVMLDHEAVTSARVSDAGPGPVTSAGGHRQPRGHGQRPGVARGRAGRTSRLRVVLRIERILQEKPGFCKSEHTWTTCWSWKEKGVAE